MLLLNIFLESTCRTVEGPDPGKSCIFPFIIDGYIFNECATSHNDDDDHVTWCSTLTDEEGIHQEGNWGTCAPECQDGNITYTRINLTKIKRSKNS